MALELTEEEERGLAELRAGLKIAEAQFLRGEGRWVSSREDSAELVDEIHQRGLATLAAAASEP